MKKLFQAIYLAVRSIPALGMIGSIKLMLAGFTSGNYRIRPRGYAHFLTVRGNTSDYAVFHTIFCRDAYPVPKGEPVRAVIDAGANAGYASVFFAHHCPQAKIIAIEPESSNYAILKRNTSGYPQVQVMHAALASSHKEMRIANPQAEKWAFRFTDQDKNSDQDNDTETAQRVETCTIPDVLRAFELDFVDILKIDIEGGEKDLFSQNTQWLPSVRRIFIEVHRGCWKTLAAALMPYDYDCKISREYLVIELRSAPQPAERSTS